MNAVGEDSNEQPMGWLPEHTERDVAERVFRLNSLLPAGYAAYVRIFHVLHRDDRSEASWAEVAEWSGKTRHRLAQFEELATTSNPKTSTLPWDGQPPREGTLSAQQISFILPSLLADTTSTHGAACWWEGFVATNNDHLTSHDRLGYRVAPIELARTTDLMMDGKSPQFWWPDDRSWCIASNIDLHATYVGCSINTADALRRVDGLECVSADIGDRIDFESDDLNRPRS